MRELVWSVAGMYNSRLCVVQRATHLERTEFSQFLEFEIATAVHISVTKNVGAFGVSLQL